MTTDEINTQLVEQGRVRNIIWDVYDEKMRQLRLSMRLLNQTMEKLEENFSTMGFDMGPLSNTHNDLHCMGATADGISRASTSLLTLATLNKTIEQGEGL